MSSDHGDHGGDHGGHGGNHGDHRGGHGDHGDHHAAMVADFRRRFWVSAVLTLPVLVLSPMIQEAFKIRETLSFSGEALVQWGLATAVFLYGGWPFLAGFGRELKQRKPGMMTLIAVAIVVAYGYSTTMVFGLSGKVFFWELATLVDVMLLGHWMEMRAVKGASGALEELARLVPDEAERLRDDGSTETVPLSEVRRGDRVRVRPGGRVPADGTVVDGHSRVDESMLTGESRPVRRGEGDRVIGGSVSTSGALTVRVERTGDESYLAQVTGLVQEAQASRSRGQDAADRAAAWLTGVALAVGGLTLVAWLAAGKMMPFALERMVTVMVITCPHALGLAVPLVVAVSTSLAASAGLLIRDRAAFEAARHLDTVIFDKTGTLTRGVFEVREVVALGDASEDEVLRLAAAVERLSEHPIGRAIVERAGEDGGAGALDVEDFKAMSGRGVQAMVDGRKVRVVDPRRLGGAEAEALEDRRVRKAREAGHTVVAVAAGERVVGAVALGDVVRPESREAVAALREAGVRVMMLTGDAAPVARAVARELGLDDDEGAVLAEVLPDDKADCVREVRERGERVAMVGDGVNDAPALAEADLGVAIGAGTHVAVETADVVLVRSDPRDVAGLLRLARATHRKVVQNLWWAAGYNIVAIPLAAGVLAPVGLLLPPAVGAVVMSVSTVVVAVNAKLLRIPGDAGAEGDADRRRSAEAEATA